MIQAALVAAFLNMAMKMDAGETQPVLQLVNLPKPVVPTLVQQHFAKRNAKDSGSSPANLKGRAAEIASPKSLVQVRRTSEIVTVERPHQGVDPAEGEAKVQGPGNGAGGVGKGSGNGTGDGAGNGGAVAEPPHLATPVLSGYDFPREMLKQWPRSQTVFLRLRIDARGIVSECMLDRGTNVRAIDSEMCNMAYERLRFRPALDRSGQAVAGWFGYAQPAPR
jgi:protein TonB